MMANMDNKIVFDEHEFPTFDVDEVEVSSSHDAHQLESATKQPASDCIDDIPVIAGNITTGPEIIVSSQPRKTTARAPEKKTKKNPVVLTRSKARKAALEQQANMAIATNQTTLQITTRASKRRNEEIEQPQSKRVVTDSDLEAVTNATSSTMEVNRLYEQFEKLFGGDFECNRSRDAYCIMGCKRAKATVLLPCQHQPTCNQCFVLWKVFVDQKKKNVFCPSCKIDVKKHISVSCD